MSDCLICGSPVEQFLSFGKMPIANGFLLPSQFADEYFFDLAAGFCPVCAMVQLMETVPPDRLFHENYAFFSSTSERMARHFEQFAGFVLDRYIRSADPFVVEMGSNDGVMLRHFARRGIRHLGIEPSANVAQAARGRGVNTLADFFSAATARRILSEYGPADAFLCANVMCHIPDLHSVAEGISLLLRPGGILVFEDPYLGDIVGKCAFDQIYDEHVFYFSVTSIRKLFERHGLEVIDVCPQDVHGGSMRYVIAHSGAYPPSAEVAARCENEKQLGLHVSETYHGFRRRVEKSREELRGLLSGLRHNGKRVAGYAATSKSTTVTNYCAITPDQLEYISDTTPIKIGKFSPGAHIPVRSHEEFQQRYPDYALLFGWNHAGEIMAKERAFSAAGGQWIVYVPAVQVAP